MAATIKDLAEKTGLSLATISKYLNGGNVLSANRSAIEEAIDKLGYSVNATARALKTKRSMTVGVLIPDLENVFCTSIVSHLENRLIKSGYSTLICNYQKSARLEREKFDFLADRQIDGLVSMPLVGYPEGMERLNSRNIPIVLIDRPVKCCQCDVIVINNRQIAFSAVKKLIDAGHKHIAIICGPKNVYTAKERLQGYIDAHAANNLKIEDSLVRYGDYYTKSGFTQTKTLMKSTLPPTALFITNNEMTVGSMLAISDLGIKIPEKLSIIGFDNQILATVTKPKLSVVLQPLKNMGHLAADLILRRIQEKLQGINLCHHQSGNVSNMHEINAVLISGNTIARPSYDD